MELIKEFTNLANLAAATRARIEEPEITNALRSIESVCKQAKRSWSGSNIGYHASVYYLDLQPKPPGVEFSPEWGLEDAWPSHQPDPGWVAMDYDAVIDELLSRAGSPDIEAIESVLTVARAESSSLKETTLSLISASLQIQRDNFVDRKLEEIKPITFANRDTIAPTLIPNGLSSRDSLAISQGKRLAPHQSLIALHLSATVLVNALNTIEAVARETGLHLDRLGEIGTRKSARQGSVIGLRGSNMQKVFIGHGQSKIWLELQNFLRDRLKLPVEEFNSIPVAGLSNKERLEDILNEAGFAFIIMTPEDEQPDGSVRARQNVVHEVGLFQGRLGFRKAIVLLEEPCEEFSNIQGLAHIHFPQNRLPAAFEEIRRVLEREGIVTSFTEVGLALNPKT